MEIRIIPDQPVLSLRFRTPLKEMGTNLKRAYQAIFAYLEETGEEPAGVPFALYHDQEYRPEDIDTEACVPVKKPLEGKGEVRGYVLKGGRVASAVHSGSYRDIEATHRALTRWFKDQGYRQAGPSREVYLVGMEDAKDPSDLRTEIIYPVEPL